MITVSALFLIAMVAISFAVGYGIRSALAKVEASVLHDAVTLLSEVLEFCSVARALPPALTQRIRAFHLKWGGL